MAEASFLFESDVTTFIDEIDKRALRVWYLSEQQSVTPVGAAKVRLVDEWGKEMMWLTEQLPELKRRFAPYLKFAVWRGGLPTIPPWAAMVVSKAAMVVSKARSRFRVGK